jgi:hypothetical protein
MDEFLLIGYKGQTPLEPGYFYCPYVPRALGPTDASYIDTTHRPDPKALLEAYNRGWCIWLFMERYN